MLLNMLQKALGNRFHEVKIFFEILCENNLGLYPVNYVAPSLSKSVHNKVYVYINSRCSLVMTRNR